MPNKIKAIIITVSLIAAAFVLSISVKSYANDRRGREYREATERREAEYERDVRNYLENCGFKNAGINLTKEFDENRNVTYKLVINHHSLEYACDEKLSDMEVEFYIKAEEYLGESVKTEFSF